MHIHFMNNLYWEAVGSNVEMKDLSKTGSDGKSLDAAAQGLNLATWEWLGEQN